MIIIFIIVFAIFSSLSVYHFLSGKRLLLDVWELWQINQNSLVEADNFCSANPKRSDIIISLTTLPSRIHKLDITLKSLLMQNLSVECINVYIPAYSKREQAYYTIPERFSLLKNVNFIHSDRDWGPATKFIPALESCTERQPILVVDDDNFYPATYLSDFEIWSKKMPESTLTGSGWKVPDDLIDRPTTLFSNIRQTPPTPLPGTRIQQPRATDIVQGFAGYLIRKSFFNLQELKDYSQTPGAAWFVDDVWISAHCKVDKVIIPLRRFCFVPLSNSKFYKSTSLARINSPTDNPHQRNNTIMIQYFAKKWKNQNP